MVELLAGLVLGLVLGWIFCRLNHMYHGEGKPRRNGFGENGDNLGSAST